MNEFYAADPACLQSVGDLRYLFQLFGPETGRYLAAYPADWRNQVLAHFADLPERKQEEVKLIFRRARENMIYLSNPNLPWTPDEDWVKNALNIKRMTPPRIDAVIGIVDQEDVLSFNDLALSTTSGELVAAKPEEYARVTRTLIANSGELLFIDPYLNPCKRPIHMVLMKLLQAIAQGRKCQSVVCYARASNVMGVRSFSWDELVSAWKALLSDVQWQPNRRFRYILVDDDTARTKMHGRYIFSIKGGIRLEQGFQQLPNGRTVDISPIGKAIHEELLMTYLEGKHDMQRMQELVL